MLTSDFKEHRQENLLLIESFFSMMPLKFQSAGEFYAIVKEFPLEVLLFDSGYSNKQKKSREKVYISRNPNIKTYQQ